MGSSVGGRGGALDLRGRGRHRKQCTGLFAASKQIGIYDGHGLTQPQQGLTELPVFPFFRFPSCRRFVSQRPGRTLRARHAASVTRMSLATAQRVSGSYAGVRGGYGGGLQGSIHLT